jgi:hypothetical protein
VLENHCALLCNYPPDARTTREMTDPQTITAGDIVSGLEPAELVEVRRPAPFCMFCGLCIAGKLW